MIEAILQILIMLLVAFLLGFAIAWLWRQSAINLVGKEIATHRKRLADTNQSLEEMRDTNESLQDQLDQKAQSGNVDYRALRAELAKVKQLNLSLNNQNDELQKQSNLLQDQLVDIKKDTSASNTHQQLSAALSRLESRNKMLEGNVKDLEERNQWLMDHRSETEEKESVPEKEMDEIASEDPELEKYTNAFPEVPTASEPSSSFTASVGIKEADVSEKDDLKKIHGVGPYIEQKLNAIGIYTYEQISVLDSEQIKKVTEAIEFFPGRIERDDWMSQARSLMSTDYN
ncbi:MAG: hypothetical protein ACR2MX_02345 [Cyclobacteriaceae bacterium]